MNSSRNSGGLRDSGMLAPLDSGVKVAPLMEGRVRGSAPLVGEQQRHREADRSGRHQYVPDRGQVDSAEPVRDTKSEYSAHSEQEHGYTDSHGNLLTNHLDAKLR